MALGTNNAQTTYTQNPAVALAGLVDSNAPVFSVSKNPDTGVTDPGPGYFAIRGTSFGLFKLPSQATDITGAPALGILAYQPGLTPTTYNVSQFQPNVPRRIVRRGIIWVVVEDTPTDGAAVYVRYSAGTFSVLGAFRTDADTSTAALLSNAKFYGTPSGGLCRVEINLP